MSPLGRGLAWLPDIAATLLAMVLVLVAVAALRPEAGTPARTNQRQVPAGPTELVEAFWQALHPEGRAVLAVTADGAALQEGGGGPGEPLVFVLSHEGYPAAVAALRARGVAGWREISVPPALGGPEGWNPRFLALAEAGVTRAEFPAALARVLDQGAGGRAGGGAAAPAPARNWQDALRRAGNLALFLSGLAVLAWLRRARRA